MQTALIVGGAGAIGSATANLLVNEGWRIALAGRSAQRLEAVRSAMPSSARVYCVSFDALNWSDVQKGLTDATARVGDLDAVINCAGIQPGSWS